MVVPSPPFLNDQRPEMDPLSKESLRRAALDARKAFVRTLSDADRARLEHRLAQHLTSLFAGVSVVAGYHPLGSEVSPLPAMEEARAVGAIAAFPCFSNPAKPFKFLAGDPLEPGPFGIMQPAKRHPSVEPDLVLVPLIAVDSKGTRLGRGKGHYDRALIGLKKSKARLVGIGWSIQRLTEIIPADEWDVPLDAFASPDGVEIFKR
jgi:5-formyltetrahydrofolate cyclo-ligase